MDQTKPKDDEKQQQQQQTTTNEPVASTEPGMMKLQIRTARIQKYITVDENTSIKDVSVSTHLFISAQLPG